MQYAISCPEELKDLLPEQPSSSVYDIKFTRQLDRREIVDSAALPVFPTLPDRTFRAFISRRVGKPAGVQENNSADGTLSASDEADKALHAALESFNFHDIPRLTRMERAFLDGLDARLFSKYQHAVENAYRKVSLAEVDKARAVERRIASTGLFDSEVASTRVRAIISVDRIPRHGPANIVSVAHRVLRRFMAAARQGTLDEDDEDVFAASDASEPPEAAFLMGRQQRDEHAHVPPPPSALSQAAESVSQSRSVAAAAAAPSGGSSAERAVPLYAATSADLQTRSLQLWKASSQAGRALEGPEPTVLRKVWAAERGILSTAASVQHAVRAAAASLSTMPQSHDRHGPGTRDDAVASREKDHGGSDSGLPVSYEQRRTELYSHYANEARFSNRGEAGQVLSEAANRTPNSTAAPPLLSIASLQTQLQGARLNAQALRRREARARVAATALAASASTAQGNMHNTTASRPPGAGLARLLECGVTVVPGALRSEIYQHRSTLDRASTATVMRQEESIDSAPAARDGLRSTDGDPAVESLVQRAPTDPTECNDDHRNHESNLRETDSERRRSQSSGSLSSSAVHTLPLRSNQALKALPPRTSGAAVSQEVVTQHPTPAFHRPEVLDAVAALHAPRGGAGPPTLSASLLKSSKNEAMELLRRPAAQLRRLSETAEIAADSSIGFAHRGAGDPSALGLGVQATNSMADLRRSVQLSLQQASPVADRIVALGAVTGSRIGPLASPLRPVRGPKTVTLPVRPKHGGLGGLLTRRPTTSDSSVPGDVENPAALGASTLGPVASGPTLANIGINRTASPKGTAATLAVRTAATNAVPAHADTRGAEALTQQLSHIMNLLEMPAFERVAFIAKYSGNRVASHLREACTLWEAAALGAVHAEVLKHALAHTVNAREALTLALRIAKQRRKGRPDSEEEDDPVIWVPVIPAETLGFLASCGVLGTENAAWAEEQLTLIPPDASSKYYLWCLPSLTSQVLSPSDPCSVRHDTNAAAVSSPVSPSSKKASGIDTVDDADEEETVATVAAAAMVTARAAFPPLPTLAPSLHFRPVYRSGSVGTAISSKMAVPKAEGGEASAPAASAASLRLLLQQQEPSMAELAVSESQIGSILEGLRGWLSDSCIKVTGLYGDAVTFRGVNVLVALRREARAGLIPETDLSTAMRDDVGDE